LFRRTGGHPLFTVELLREMRARGDIVQDAVGAYVEGEQVDWDTLPSRVEAVIAHRFSRLPAAVQEALKVASIEGESFTAEVIAQVLAVGGAQIVRQLSAADRQHRLVRSLGSDRLGEQPLSHYRFRHILFQSYLYEILGPAERSYLHEAVGRALEQIYAGQTESVAVQLAYHFEMAGLATKAVEYLRQAGERATQLSAYEETIAHLTRGLSLLHALPDSLERIRQELRLEILHGVSLLALKGLSAEETKDAYERAGALAQRAGELDQLVAVLYGQFSVSFVGGNIQTALALGKQCLDLAKRQDDPSLLVAGYWTTMAPSIHLGAFKTAEAHAQQALEAYERLRHPFPFATFTVELGVFTLAYDAHCAWYLGKADTALAHGRQAVQVAERRSHPFSLTVAQAYLAMLHGYRREWPQAYEWAEAAELLSTKHNFPYYQAWATFVRGWALAEQGQLDQGIALMKQGMADFRAMRTGLREPFYLALLGEAYAKQGNSQTGLQLFAQALAAAERSGERCYEAEIWRLRGELTKLQGEATDAVEACYTQALATARQQEAKSLQLRAAASLAQLWHEQGNHPEAHCVLSETYAWFSEGFDTADLQEAKALLDEPG
jgi:predicted ATPase